MSKLINLSEAAFLAIHSMSLIAKADESRLNVHKLAEMLEASPAHLAKVFQKLNKADLTISVRGPAGGFELKRPAKEITFLDIYEAIVGKVALQFCPLGKNRCTFEKCIFKSDLNRISAEILDTYKNITLADV